MQLSESITIGVCFECKKVSISRDRRSTATSPSVQDRNLGFQSGETRKVLQEKFYNHRLYIVLKWGSGVVSSDLSFAFDPSGTLRTRPTWTVALAAISELSLEL